MADRKELSVYRTALCVPCQHEWSTLAGFDVAARAEEHADETGHTVRLTEDFTYDVWPTKSPEPATKI